MNGLNGKPTEYPENALVPYPVILAASKGDPDAMKIVLQHFSGYIASLSMRKLYDERGNVYFGVILSILVDTFSSRILNPMLLPSGKRNIVVF